MKRVALLLLLLLLPIASAVQVEMGTSFKQGETMLAKVSGNFLTPVQDQNIFFYRGHVKIPMDYDIAKIENKYYIYANLPETTGAYNIAIENVEYMDGSQQSEEDITKNFTITNETAAFSIDKGFVITNQDFSVTVQNLMGSETTITSNFLEESQSKDLFSGAIKRFNFDIENQETILKTLTLSSSGQTYEIPIQIVSNKSSEEDKKSFRIVKDELRVNISTDKETSRVIYLENTGNIDLENISIYVSSQLEDYIFLSTNFVDKLETDSSQRIEINFLPFSDPGHLEGQITARYSNSSFNLYAYSDLTINIILNYEPDPEEEEEPVDPIITKTCSEMDGEICASDKTCEGSTEEVNGLSCCLGDCEEKQTGFSSGKIIGWIIVAAIVIFLFWFFKTKYRGKIKPVDLVKIGKRK